MGLDDVLQEVASEDQAIEVVYLFGSQATGRAHPKSDVDVGILYVKGHQVGLKELVRLAQEIEDRAGLKTEVEVVSLNGKDARFLEEVIRGGKPVYVKDESKKVEFEAQNLIRYLDYQHYLREYDKFVKKRVTS